jgi:putative membrane protein
MSSTDTPRKPQAFTVDEATISEAKVPPEAMDSVGGEPDEDLAAQEATARPSPSERLQRGIRWGAVLVSAASALASLAFALWFARFVSIAVERQDWIGWTAAALLALVAIAGAAILLREIVGFARLARLSHLKQEAERSLRERDGAAERRIVDRIAAMLAHRPELKWHLARLHEHARDVRDPGDLFRLTDRDLLAPLDNEARRIVTRTAKRVSIATAISPVAFFSVAWVLVENVRLLRALASLYGGRPGLVGTARLGRMVFIHLVATGGVALTDDLLGQFLGQDMLRRLSRRLGEGIFNAALTARIGTAAIEVIRPLPFIEARPVRVRDFLVELTRGPEAQTTGGRARGNAERRP